MDAVAFDLQKEDQHLVHQFDDVGQALVLVLAEIILLGEVNLPAGDHIRLGILQDGVQRHGLEACPLLEQLIDQIALLAGHIAAFSCSLQRQFLPLALGEDVFPDHGAIDL